MRTHAACIKSLPQSSHSYCAVRRPLRGLAQVALFCMLAACPGADAPGADAGASTPATRVSDAGGVLPVMSSFSLEEACIEEASSYCSRLNACTPNALTYNFATEEACRDRLKIRCKTTVSAPDAKVTPQQVKACADAERMQACPQFITAQRPDACIYKGSRENGSSCSQDSQCQNGLCLNAGFGCGTCGQAKGLLESCAVADRCANRLVCLGGKCKKQQTLSGTCGSNGECENGLYVRKPSVSTGSQRKAIGATRQRCLHATLTKNSIATVPSAFAQRFNSWALAKRATTEPFSAPLEPMSGHLVKGQVAVLGVPKTGRTAIRTCLDNVCFRRRAYRGNAAYRVPRSVFSATAV